MQEQNIILWKYYFESDKYVMGYMERMHWLWIEREGRDMTKQRLRTDCGAGRTGCRSVE